MAGKGYPVVLFPRYTALVGAGWYPGLPIEVSPYHSVLLSVWRGALGGTTPSLAFGFQESLDRDHWTACDCSPSPHEGPVGDEQPYVITFSKPWFRMTVELFGTGASVTLWAVGTLLRREE